MKIARFKVGNKIQVGLVEGNAISLLSGRIEGIEDDTISLMERWSSIKKDVEACLGANDYKVSEIELLSPIRRPGKIFGIGLNYSDHAEESGLGMPEYQTWFVKAATATNGPNSPIELPRASDKLDYEGEMVFIIGKKCRHVPAEHAGEVIFGYCIGNDVSVRDWQLRTGQFSIGKSFDTHAPFGPWIVTPEEIDPGNVGIRTFVNGEKRQESNTSHLIYDCAAQVEHLSQAMTLEPGDVIFTGTPAGVGAVMDPPQFLKAGDRVRVEIDSIGYIENEVVAEAVN